MDRNELDALGIVEWSALEADFVGSDLLLGNGFSVSMWPDFNYSSLFDKFLATCGEADRHAFEAFDTSNFEFILEDLSSADKVNRIFGIGGSEVPDAISKIRTGLITTIHDIHPTPYEIDWDRLHQIPQQLEPFGDIYTVNYDALIYHVILSALDRFNAGIGPNRYNDYFWNRVSNRYLQFMDFQDYEPYRHIYYLHGALFLFRGSQEDLKLRKNSASEGLLELISNALNSGEVPLFVSEGTSEQKMRAISRSHYLRFCYDKLREKREKLVMYGISLSPAQDQHIIDAIKRKTEHIAIAVYPGDKSAEQLRDDLDDFASKFPSHDLRFFDATTLFQPV